MLARIRKSQESEGGFTLIELLVVMIIIGILAAIAIPVFLNQRKKAQDTAAKADVSTIGKEIATYYVDNTSPPTVAQTAGRYSLSAAAVVGPPAIAAYPATDLGKSSNNVQLLNQFIVDATHWCITVQNPQGDKAVVGTEYSAAGGLTPGVACTSANG